MSEKRNYGGPPDFNLRTYDTQLILPDVASMRSEKIISQTRQEYGRALTNLEMRIIRLEKKNRQLDLNVLPSSSDLHRKFACFA